MCINIYIQINRTSNVDFIKVINVYYLWKIIPFSDKKVYVINIFNIIQYNIARIKILVTLTLINIYLAFMYVSTDGCRHLVNSIMVMLTCLLVPAH